MYLFLLHIELFSLTAFPIEENKSNKAFLGIPMHTQSGDDKMPTGKTVLFPVTNMGEHDLYEGDKHHEILGMVPLKDFSLEMVPLKTFLKDHTLPSHVKLMLMNCDNSITKNE